MKDPDRWQLRDILRLIGGGLLCGAVVIGFMPMVGDGGGKSYKPGSDWARWLSLNSDFAKWALVGIAIGLLVLLVSVFVPRADD